MDEAAARVRTGEVTQAVRDSVGRVRPDRQPATGSRITRDGIVGGGEVGRPTPRVALLDELVDDDSEIVTVLVGADADADGHRAHPRAHRVHASRTSRSSSTTAASRSTRTSSASSSEPRCRPGDPPAHAARAARRAASTDLKGVGRQARAGLADMGIETVLDLLAALPAPLGRPHEAGRDRRARGRRGGDGRSPRCARSTRAARATASARSSNVDRLRRHRRCSRSRSSTRPGASSSCAPGTEVSLFGKVDGTAASAR